MEIQYDKTSGIYSVGDQKFPHSTFVEWVASGGLIETLLRDKVYLKSDNSVDTNSKEYYPLQRIYYGAPGTGKSYGIQKIIEKFPTDHIFRTTFHPDSDYSSFVGCYKPTMSEPKDVIQEPQIVYKFVEQIFLRAYVRAWELYAQSEQIADVFLIIEEINRGNCAQIFGDLFQLLDRNELGFSEYPIIADEDVKRYLKKEFTNFPHLTQLVQEGAILQLPPNLHIWATMNTSDQSLFPIDSAFKRRWEWAYCPIVDSHKNYKIKVDAKYYDWWLFVQAINDKIGMITHSEDKKLGYFFVKANSDNVISTETFVNKVVFYLWNDIFKDYPQDSPFNVENGLGSFFNDSKINTKVLDDFLVSLGLQESNSSTYSESLN